MTVIFDDQTAKAAPAASRLDMVPATQVQDAARIAALIAERQSDQERWRQPLPADRSWERRLKMAAAMVMPGSSVLDLGCGKMDLHQYLPGDCRYIPADIVKRSEDTHLIELNSGVWPEVRADCATALGVLEYIYDAEAFFRGVSRCAPLLVFTYHVRTEMNDANREIRLRNGWLSDFSLIELMQALEVAGGRLLRLHGYMPKLHFIQYFFKVDFPTAMADTR